MSEQLEPGVWYLCAQCPLCAITFAYMENPGDNDDPPTGLLGAGPMTCSQCGSAFVFQFAQTRLLRSRQTATGVVLEAPQ